MTRRSLRLVPDAEQETAAAAEWYESKRAGLGSEFLIALDSAFGRILESPESSPVWRTGDPFRKHVIQRFPYVVFFKIHEEHVEIIAVANANRRPGYWLDR